MNSTIVPGLRTIAEREALLLAPYAMHTSGSRGRRFPEPVHAYRGVFQRDRDRILHSAAFRRLSGKMQVFTGDMGDYHRTRLTHTHEVASIARTIGRSLRLNEDLVEALALFHDIGHPPFGHAGESTLDECLKEHGGFSHNRYALTIAEELELRNPDYQGLNLSMEVLDGQADRVDKGDQQRRPLLEVQLVDAADSVAYDAHDTDDAVKLGLVTLDELSELKLIDQVVKRVRRRWADADGDSLRKAIVHELIDWQVSDILSRCGEYLDNAGFVTAQQAKDADFRIDPSAELAEMKAELETFLFQRVYRHPDILRMRAMVQNNLVTMFNGLCERADLLPPRYRQRADSVGLQRSVGDYLAGMTDRFCLHQFERHFSGGSTDI